MITHFCRYCWHEHEPGVASCPACGEPTKGEELPYREKLELALLCPEALTARRAAYLLGRIADPASVPALASALASGDPYVAAEAVTALARIGTPEAVALVEGAKTHSLVTVRAAVASILSSTGER